LAAAVVQEDEAVQATSAVEVLVILRGWEVAAAGGLVGQAEMAANTLAAAVAAGETPQVPAALAAAGMLPVHLLVEGVADPVQVAQAAVAGPQAIMGLVLHQDGTQAVATTRMVQVVAAAALVAREDQDRTDTLPAGPQAVVQQANAP
jgi:hypothetical protein